MEFMTDQPISSSSEDKLNRTSFADLLAKAILSYRETKSLVLALYGTWGSGKTSILNLTLEHICTAVKNINNDAKPIIVSFNPWYFSEQNQLISQFFKQLSVTLKRVDYASQAKAISEKIDIYSKFFDPLVLVPVAGSFIGVLLSVVRGAGKGIKGWSEAKSASLDSVKKDLDRLFDLQKNKTIIVIDDLDRLSDVEIRQMFQLVKSVCDFHNTIYLLAFDKKVVARALDRFQEEQGFAYLEKVIQVPFEIPLVSRQNLETLLLNNITNLIKDVPEDKFDNMRWWNLYAGVLKYYFRNIRDINRYINSLRFGYHLIKDELNTVDYLAISALQVFIPEVYLQIRSNRLLFSGIVDSTGRSNEQTREQERKNVMKSLAIL